MAIKIMRKEYLFIFLIFMIIFIGTITSEEIDKKHLGKNLGFSNPNDVFVPGGASLLESDNGVTVDGGSLTYNHDGTSREYKNIKSGGRFVFKDKKLSSCEFETTDDSTYAFGNHNVKVPKGSKVTFKDNKVTVEVLKDSLIEKPERISGSKENDVKVDYKFLESSDTIKIKDGKEYTITKSGGGVSISYDGKVDAFLAEGEYSVNGLKIGEFDKDNRKNYLFFDGAKHDLKEGSYVSMGDKIVIGAAKGFESPSVQFLKGNGVLDIKEKDFIVMQSNGGQIIVEKRNSEGKIPRVTSQGDYTIFAGNQVIRYKDDYKAKYGGPILKPNKNNLGVDFGSAGTTPMQIVTLDSNGERTGKWDVVVDNNRGIRAGLHDVLESDYLRIGGGQVTSIRESFYSLTKEDRDKLATLSPERQREFFGMDSSQIRSALAKVTQINNELKTNTAQGYANYDNNPRYRAGGETKSLNVHEDVHVNINTELSRDGKYAFYLGNGEYALVAPVGIAKGSVQQTRGADGTKTIVGTSGTALYIPMETVAESTTNNYFGSMFSNRDVTHVFEDDSAFRAGAKAFMNDALAGRLDTKGYGIDDLPALTNFIVYDIASGMYVQSKGSNYWNGAEGAQYRGYIKRAVEDNMALINQAYSDNRLSRFRKGNDIDVDWGPVLGVQERLNLLRTSQTPQAVSMRKFVKDTYGADWAKRVLGF